MHLIMSQKNLFYSGIVITVGTTLFETRATNAKTTKLKPIFSTTLFSYHLSSNKVLSGMDMIFSISTGSKIFYLDKEVVTSFLFLCT